MTKVIAIIEKETKSGSVIYTQEYIDAETAKKCISFYNELAKEISITAQKKILKIVEIEG